ncbi:uncharacterized protein LOC135475981 isoform X2 [Liolophura sinensis]|uniref:uncharacterized protein LOC135475981 isoform X2 n=1 Tax=Liolophura sinensis TaxID=3198878 RepID=UPI003158D071
MDDPKIDSLTDRPRAPNVPYTVLSDEQVKNMKKDPSPHFRIVKPIQFDNKRHYVDRYAYCTNAQVVRGMSRNHPHCWIDYQKVRDAPTPYHTSRLGSTVKWGPITAGRRTYQHYMSEEPHSFTMIDMYRRPPTNTPGLVTMAYGRPGEGYYSQRRPDSTTWFGSTVPLNRTSILQNVQHKTFAEYRDLKTRNDCSILSRRGQWPEYSEYSDKYCLQSKMAPKLNTT